MIDTFIRRPVFTTMFILVLIVFGIRSYPGLGVDLYPHGAGRDGDPGYQTH